ncbi:acyl-coenzyme A thioesterase 13-like [Trichoplusia ni]|uniref:Acyl-coenzyme A thioesterase 13-like n=1 Tax=Trichoplusia ni TaxID=7111 RepID=A0A7E5VHC3_TRINI|nr:acyl-coenzyme A thioesterase 13-like [Trichoplusia ni]
MAANKRALRLVKAMDYLSTKSSLIAFENNSLILNKVKLEASSNGALKASFVVDKPKCNIGGILHGGYIAAMVDFMSYAAVLMTPNGRLSYTTNMNINYVKSVWIGEKVLVETKSLKSGKSPLIETYFHGEDGTLLAKGTTAFLAAEEKYQNIPKETINFDVYED